MNTTITDTITQTSTHPLHSSTSADKHAEASSPDRGHAPALSSPETGADSATDTSASTATTREPRESHRLGKIARLPRDIRQELNERLADNEPSEAILLWVNSLPEVQRVLEELFDGRSITKQNVSTWRLGGFRDWERAQEARSRARAFLEEAEEVTEELKGGMEWDGAGCPPFLDRVTDRVALGLLELFQEAEMSEKGPRRTREMLEIARELARLRRGDHQQRRLAVQQERWQDAQNVAEEEREKRNEQELQEMDNKAREMKAKEYASLQIHSAMFRDEYLRALAEGKMTPEKEKATRKYFEQMGPRMQELGIEGLPKGRELKKAVAAKRAELQRKAEEEAAERKRGKASRRPGRSNPVQAGQSGKS